MVLGFLVFKEDLFAIKGGPNPGPHQQPPILRASQGVALKLSWTILGVDGFLRVLDGCARENCVQHAT
jgi:hypothetical protein